MTLFQNENSEQAPRWAWLFAAGPAVWSLYFWMEARADEMRCSVDAWPLVLWATLGLAGLIMVTMSYHASRAQPRSRHIRHPSSTMMRDGFLLGAGLLAASLLVGVPTLLAHPC